MYIAIYTGGGRESKHYSYFFCQPFALGLLRSLTLRRVEDGALRIGTPTLPFSSMIFEAGL